MYIYATIYQRDYFEKKISLKQIQDAILRITTSANIQVEEISRALKQAGKSKQRQKDVVIAKGVPPVQGKNAQLILKENEEEEENTDSIDYREINTFTTVKENEIVGRLFPPTQGKSGKDIFGREILPPSGSNLNYTAGENVQAATKTDTAEAFYESGYISKQELSDYSDEQMEITEFVALASGILRVKENTISIEELLEIKGNVDYSTGNIRLEKGSVKIKGTILSGFIVSAPGDIFVSQTIEDAQVEAGNNLEVKGGIVAGDWGKVNAKGNINAHYIENAHIELFMPTKEKARCREELSKAIPV